MNRSTHTLTGLAAAAALSTVVALSAVVPAEAKDGDVIRRGSCSGPADWKLKASPENGRIEVEGEIDTSRNGQVWKWRMWHEGSLTAKGTRETKAPSGSFTVRRVLVNVAGSDQISFRATRPATGQTCRGSLSF